MSMSSVMSNQPYQPLEKVEPNSLSVSENQPFSKVGSEDLAPPFSKVDSEDLAPPFPKVESNVESKVDSKDLAPPFPKVVKVVKVVKEAVEKLSKKYNFEVEEALLYLSQPSQPLKKVEPKVKSESLKSESLKNQPLKSGKVEASKYPMPFDGIKREECCNGLVKNHGLYTQCSKKVKGLCKGCETQAYGNIEDRVKVGLYEYKDPKGKSPKRYTEVLKTLKLSKEEVEEEAKRLNIVIAAEHLEELVVENVKRGRPKTEKKVKEATGKKGRPKKENKKVEVNDDEEEDLFATLIANVQPLKKVEPNPMPLENQPLENQPLKKVEPNPVEDVIVEEAKDLAPPLSKVEKKAKKVDPVKEEEKQKKAEEKAAKDAAKEAEKQKKAEEKAAKEAEKQKKAEEKAAKEALKESKKKSKDLAPPLAKVDNLAPPLPKVDNEEADVVKKLEFEGKSYYKSKKSGVIYNMEQEVVGKWNEERKGIDFEEEEEEEEEYDD